MKELNQTMIDFGTELFPRLEGRAGNQQVIEEDGDDDEFEIPPLKTKPKP